MGREKQRIGSQKLFISKHSQGAVVFVILLLLGSTPCLVGDLLGLSDSIVNHFLPFAAAVLDFGQQFVVQVAEEARGD